MFPEQEEEFPDMPVGVALHGLTKTYGRRHAIHNLNLAFYEGHVTTLLGHNGAGKTTTMYAQSLTDPNSYCIFSVVFSFLYLNYCKHECYYHMLSTINCIHGRHFTRTCGT